MLGCDGAHSTVREQCGIPFEGHGIQMHFSLADLELEGPDKPVDEMLLYLHHGNVVFIAPLSENLTRVIVARQADADTCDAQLTTAYFQQAIDEAGAGIRVVNSEWMTPFHVNDRQAARYRAGNIFLAGDASHIYSPIGGQGMNTGIQDAANLCWKIAAVERGSNTPDRLLDSYEEERATVGKSLLTLTERVLKLTTVENPVAIKLRDLIAPHVSDSSSVQKSAAGFIAETAIEYRSSPVVSDHGGEGELRAGDRLPDLELLHHASGSSTLLGRWTSGRHLAISVEATEAQVSEPGAPLSNVDVIFLSAANLDVEGRRLLGAKPSLLLVRPDGYIGFRGSLDQPENWRAYGRQDGLC